MAQNSLDRTRALAGIFQSAALAKEVASCGQLDQVAYAVSIKSIFKLDPDSVADIYGNDDCLSLGYSSLKLALHSDRPAEVIDTARYALGLVHVESLLHKRDDLLNILRSRVERCAEQSVHFDSMLSEPIISQLAETYVDTVGTFRFRIQVKGDANLLQQQNYANKIRAIFLAGVRSAMLWRQLGGRRWHLMFFRKRELSNVIELRNNEST